MFGRRDMSPSSESMRPSRSFTKKKDNSDCNKLKRDFACCPCRQRVVENGRVPPEQLRQGSGNATWRTVRLPPGGITAVDMMFVALGYDLKNEDPLCVCFIDLQNVYDSVDGKLVWEVQWRCLQFRVSIGHPEFFRYITRTPRGWVPVSSGTCNWVVGLPRWMDTRTTYRAVYGHKSRHAHKKKSEGKTTWNETVSILWRWWDDAQVYCVHSLLSS